MDIGIRPSTEKDRASTTPFDFSAMSAYNTCPTYGVLRYGHHKTWSKSKRSMATEAGHAAHEVFAAARVWSLFHKQNLPTHAEVAGLRLFGEMKWNEMYPLLCTQDDRNSMLAFCLEALYQSGFYDDPSDNRKTLSNLEASCIAYLDRVNWDRPVWVEDVTNPLCKLGIEQSFDYIVNLDGDDYSFEFRFVGRIDGIHVHPSGDIYVHENKTASRLNDAWMASFKMSHQITGYMIAASGFTGINIRNALVLGVAVPLPKSYDYGGVVTEFVERNDQQIQQWSTWVKHSIAMAVLLKSSPEDAPKYTHSCNRYFRACEFLPYCAASLEEKKEIYDFLEEDTWSPLREKADD